MLSPSGAFVLFGLSRWLAPPANIRRPSGTKRGRSFLVSGGLIGADPRSTSSIIATPAALVLISPDTMKLPALFRRSPLLLGASCLVLASLLVPAVAQTSRADLAPGDFKQWSEIAIQDNGRRKPIDTFAKETLLRLSGKTTYTSADHREWQPNDFLLSALLSESRDWKKEPIVLVNFLPLVKKLGLDPERKRFSFDELTNLAMLKTLMGEVHAIRLRDSNPELTREQQELESVNTRLTLFNHILTGEALLIVPPPAQDAPAAGGASKFVAKAPWLVPPDANAQYGEAKFAPVTEHLRGAVSAYLAGDAYNFALQGRELRTTLRSLNPALYPTDSALGLEYTYNHLGAFPWAALLYLCGLIALAVAGRRTASWASPVQWAGIALGLGGLAFHTTGLVMRCIVAGRPPVTNMYESMIWVSFVVTVLGFIFYARYRGTTYLLAALPVSAFTLFLTQQVPAALPENIDPLVPVLRDNFWLSTHVLTITASYGAFALGMGFAHILLFRYLMDPVAARADHVLHFWLYRVLQLGVLMIAIGTILGGVWANYSWGRFWGWDPKETWAFITLLCYIVALHGRIAGWWGQFGLAVAGVLCFAAVIMAWYGVNFVLGKGLHSYGKGIGGEGYVAAFLVADMIFLGAACWRQLSTRVPRRLAPASAAEVAGAAGELNPATQG